MSKVRNNICPYCKSDRFLRVYVRCSDIGEPFQHVDDGYNQCFDCKKWCRHCETTNCTSAIDDPDRRPGE